MSKNLKNRNNSEREIYSGERSGEKEFSGKLTPEQINKRRRDISISIKRGRSLTKKLENELSINKRERYTKLLDIENSNITNMKKDLETHRSLKSNKHKKESFFSKHRNEFKPVEEDYLDKQVLEILFDGGCQSRGFSKHAYGSFQIKLGKDSVIERRDFGSDPSHTNNISEWRSLIEAIKYSLKVIEEVGFTPKNYSLDIKGDSLLVINQLTLRYRCLKLHLEKLRDEALELLKNFHSFRARWQSRVVSVEVLGH